MNKPVIYLAGPANSPVWVGLRAKLMDEFGEQFDFIDPLNHPARPTEEMGAEWLVTQELKWLDDCDGVIAFMPYPSVGTMGEIVNAYQRGMPSLILSDNPTMLAHPWLVYYSWKGGMHTTEHLFEEGIRIEFDNMEGRFTVIKKVEE